MNLKNNNNDFSEAEIYNLKQKRQLRAQLQTIWTTINNDASEAFGEKKQRLLNIVKNLQAACRSDNLENMEKTLNNYERLMSEQVAFEQRTKQRNISATERINRSRRSV